MCVADLTCFLKACLISCLYFTPWFLEVNYIYLQSNRIKNISQLKNKKKVSFYRHFNDNKIEYRTISKNNGSKEPE